MHAKPAASPAQWVTRASRPEREPERNQEPHPGDTCPRRLKDGGGPRRAARTEAGARDRTTREPPHGASAQSGADGIPGEQFNRMQSAQRTEEDGEQRPLPSRIGARFLPHPAKGDGQ